jgi:hypothetical protein
MIASLPRILWHSNKPLLEERLARCYGTRAMHLGASVTCQKSPHARWWSRAITSKLLSTNIIKATQEKGICPTYEFIASTEVGPRDIVGTLQTGYPCAQDLKD